MGTGTHRKAVEKVSWEDCKEQETGGSHPEEVVLLRLAKSNKGSGKTKDAVGR